MTATYKTSSQVGPIARAARTVDRWGLVAGVTGFLGNVLLAVLFTTPADGPHAWTGSANDTIGVALVAMAVVELAFVLGLVPFAAEVDGTFDGTFAGLIVVFGWLVAASRAGRTSGRLPRQVASCGAALGAAGLAGAVLLAASVSRPAHSLAHAITFGAGALVSGPVYVVFPVWLIVLSYRLPGHAGAPGQLV